MVKAPAPNLVPFTVALAGEAHIVPEDEPRLRLAVIAQLAALARQMPATPIRALSRLNEGADMVMAEAALDFGCELTAVLGAPADRAAEVFAAPANLERSPKALADRFADILKRAQTAVVAGDSGPGGQARAGLYMARHAHALLAVWDGEPRDDTSSVSAMVRLVGQGGPEPGDVLSPGRPRPVYVLGLPKPGGSLPEELAFRPAPGSPQELGLWRRTQAALDRFNRDSARLADKHPQALHDSLAWFGDDALSLSGPQRRTLAVFAAADALAIALQRRSRRLMRVVFALGLFMVAAFEGYAHMVGAAWALGVYVLALGLAWVVYKAEKQTEVYTRFLDYRALAEGLRVQLFFRLAGLSIQASDHYLRKQQDELGWIRDAMRALDAGAVKAKPRLDLVRRLWIDDQANYFDSSERRDKTGYKRMKTLAKTLFFLGLVVALGVLGVQLAAGFTLHHTPWLHGPVLLMGLLPAAAAALSGYAHRLALPQHAKQFARMRRIFSAASRRVKDMAPGADDRRFKQLVKELGKEALAENGDWVLTHRERPVEVPTH